jgi:hypothetical protein
VIVKMCHTAKFFHEIKKLWCGIWSKVCIFLLLCWFSYITFLIRTLFCFEYDIPLSKIKDNFF